MIFSALWDADHPSQRYRVIDPCQTLWELGLAWRFFDHQWMRPKDRDDREKSAVFLKWDNYIQQLHEALRRSNVYIYHQSGSAERGTYIDTIRKANKDASHGPPMFIYDADDHIEFIDPLNNAFAHLGTHLPDGTELKRGDVVYMPFVDSEEPQPLWEDGVRKPGTWHVFDIEANKRKVRGIYDFARKCDFVTTTTEQLADVYRKVGCKKVKVFPNSVRFNDYPDFDVHYPDDQIRILWQGGDSHYPDWHPIRDAIARVMQKYKNARLVIWGALFGHIVKNVPNDQIEHHEWVHYDVYRDKLSMMGHHINLAPLSPHPFNICKSAIKWYESSAIKHPAATLAANVGPYQEITDGDNGMLYDSAEEFEKKLSMLIESAELRQRLASNAKAWVKEHRDARDIMRSWAEWINAERKERWDRQKKRLVTA